MNYTVDDHAIVDDLYIERDGQEVTKITKSGVVIWPGEGHTAGMAKETHLKEHARQTETDQYMAGAPSRSANSYMVGGDHYRGMNTNGTCPTCKNPIQHWDWAHNLRGLEYAATKYLARWREKDGLASLKKVIHYTQKLIEIHFPDVVVSISYSNRVGAQQGSSSGQRDTLKSAVDPYQKERTEYDRTREIAKSQGMAGCQTAHSAAVVRCGYTHPNTIMRCIRFEGHEGPHDLG